MADKSSPQYISDKRKQQIFDNLIDYVSEHTTDEKDFYYSLRDIIGLTNEEMTQLGIDVKSLGINDEEDDLEEAKKITEDTEFYTDEALKVLDYIQNEMTNEQRKKLFKDECGDFESGNEADQLKEFWDWIELLDSDDIEELGDKLNIIEEPEYQSDKEFLEESKKITEDSFYDETLNEAFAFISEHIDSSDLKSLLKEDFRITKEQFENPSLISTKDKTWDLLYKAIDWVDYHILDEDRKNLNGHLKNILNGEENLKGEKIMNKDFKNIHKENEEVILKTIKKANELENITNSIDLDLVVSPEDSNDYYSISENGLRNSLDIFINGLIERYNYLRGKELENTSFSKAEYIAIEDEQGGDFAVGTCSNALDWLKQANYWEDSDDTRLTLNTFKNPDEIIFYVSEVWSLDIEKVENTNKKVVDFLNDRLDKADNRYDYEETLNIMIRNDIPFEKKLQMTRDAENEESI